MRFFLLLLLAVGVGAASCRSAAADDATDEIDVRYGQVYSEPQHDSESGPQPEPLKADVYLPRGKGPFPGVLVVHGGAWYIGTRAQLAGVAQMLARRGFAAVAISYRLAPKHKFPAQIEDCQQAVRWMRTEASRLKIDPERIGGFGYSAGAQLVCLLGTTGEGAEPKGESDLNRPSTRLQAVACGGAPCEFRVLPPDQEMLSFWLGGTRREKPEQYRLASPAAFITSDDPPMFFFHGDKDRLVPIASPEAMCRDLDKAGVEAEMYVVPDMGHTFAIMDRTALEKSVAFLSEHLQREEAR
jgi:acetyl esterase/lipase